MHTKTHALPPWIEDERSLLVYLVNPHAGRVYPEDLLDAVALLTSWVLVSMSLLLVAGVLVEGLIG